MVSEVAEGWEESFPLGSNHRLATQPWAALSGFAFVFIFVMLNIWNGGLLQQLLLVSFKNIRIFFGDNDDDDDDIDNSDDDDGMC